MKTSQTTHQTHTLVGREKELKDIQTCLSAGRNILLEGPVGVGKTHLALSAAQKEKKKFFRIDGDSRYTEQKLSGWFNPPAILKQGYSKKSFLPGPLVEAMEAGAILFINELNRLPEGVQNILLPAIDEKMIFIPRLGEIKAKPGFLVIATQNPKEFVATSHLSEALLDRFELIILDYQSFDEEIEIVLSGLKLKDSNLAKKISEAAVQIVRKTREDSRIKRGASVRAAQAIAEITAEFLCQKDKPSFELALEKAVLLALPTRIEIQRDPELNLSLHQEVELLLKELLKKKP